MLRRLVPLTPLAPAVAVILFAAAHAWAEGGDANTLQDVQIGEAGKLLRVALICSEDCSVGARAGGAFFLAGVDADLDVDLDGRSVHAQAITVEPAPGGSLLSLQSAETISRASIKPCNIDGLAASCIDIEFAMEGAANAAAPPSPKKPVRPTEAAYDQPAEDLKIPPPPAIKTAAGAGASPPPVLRDAPDEALLTFARFAPPERLEPPTVQKPLIRKDRAAAFLNTRVDIGEMASAILGKEYGPGECEAAQAHLKKDAWALSAMVDVGFCAAIDGDLDRAEGVFTRLLAYTPDNYEALVGRALIAARTGEKSLAKKYLQDALNALPPIEESDRIVEAMAKL